MPTQSDQKKFQNVETIIFDMDGVVTGESEYWNSADLTVLELLYGKQFLGLHDTTFITILHKSGICVQLNKFVSESFIALLKNSSINTNWDLAFFSAALYLIEFFASIKDKSKLKSILARPIDIDSIREIGTLISSHSHITENIDELSSYFLGFREKRTRDRETPERKEVPDQRALDFVDDINAWRYERTGLEVPVFEREDTFWKLCQSLFQEWYLGDSLLKDEGSKKIGDLPKDGMIWYENPIIPVQKIIATMAMLKEAGVKFGIATGRPYKEIMIPLHKWGLLNFFESNRISTHREITEAELFLENRGTPRSLPKPNPYIYLRSLFPDEAIATLLEMKLPINKELGKKTIIVGDSLSDLIAAKNIGCLSAVVMTGVIDLETARQMKAYEPDFILDDISGFEDLF